MSGANANNSTNIKDVIVLVAAAFIGIPLLIFFIVKLFTGNVSNSTMTDQEVLARIQPVGLSKASEGGPPGSRNGKAVYEAVCASCHGAGLAGAPKFADSAAWAPRISQGLETLVKHAVGGFKGMPAKGGAADLTDDEVARAVAFMGNASGGKFEEPKPATSGATAGKVDLAAKGKEIYESTCVACHGTGAAGAPKFGDKAAWTPRLKAGLDSLIASATQGKGAMPPKGGFAGSDEEFKAAVSYMANAAK
ncbi:c-type cytochrome [Parachitinimonas caeni]|uniref:C-type cytochrome n=1 Tax=Parachitinimonas caeni TaxID=3031301 RepID=A0ABT7E021_9NEIS|nr:c-type cytochrome [Parachitinimonas caeni]MDK2124780.1 c-type cytochrome [Parachitinimonas caeni]